MCGVQKASVLADWQEQGWFAVPMELFIDARAVWDSVAAEVLKTPCDKALLLHAKSLKEYLMQKQVSALTWVDTRNMVADALNKGIIDRVEIRRFFSSGQWLINHETKTYASK